MLLGPSVGDGLVNRDFELVFKDNISCADPALCDMRDPERLREETVVVYGSQRELNRSSAVDVLRPPAAEGLSVRELMMVILVESGRIELIGPYANAVLVKVFDRVIRTDSDGELDIVVKAIISGIMKVLVVVSEGEAADIDSLLCSMSEPEYPVPLVIYT